ncbi:MAG: hypothetical protein ACXWYS_02560, partial [Gaiellaceae bacterium]
LWEVEHFYRIVAPAPSGDRGGFTERDLAWLLTHAPTETVVLKPMPEPRLDGAGSPPVTRASTPA